MVNVFMLNYSVRNSDQRSCQTDLLCGLFMFFILFFFLSAFFSTIKHTAGESDLT